LLKLSNVRIPINHSPDYGVYAASVLGVHREQILSCTLLRKSLDARRKGNVGYICSFSVSITDEERFLAIKDVSAFEENSAVDMVAQLQDRLASRMQDRY